MRWERAILALGLAVAAVVGACADRGSPRFPHRLHLAGLECGQPGQPECLSCNSCHTVSKTDRAHRLPSEGACTSCHSGNAHEELAVLKTAPERASGKISFDHNQHLAMKEIEGQCVPCHAGVVENGKPTLPAMKQCFTCHEHQEEWNKSECTPCHSRSAIAQTLPKSFLKHDERFMRRHGQEARNKEKLCASCHSESDCDSCHDLGQTLSIERRLPEKLERKLVHRGDFMVRHSIEAQSQSARCVRCHTPDTCDTCHMARGVSANRIGSRNPHPQGWVGGNPDSKSSHGREARRDIVLCASCHDQGPATNCIRCHKVGAYGGNPHPHGWKSNQSEGSRMCGYCHE
jgi:hypothetical protein